MHVAENNEVTQHNQYQFTLSNNAMFMNVEFKWKLNCNDKLFATTTFEHIIARKAR